MASNDGQLTNGAELRDIVESFPPGVVHSFGYGSGVFQQQLLDRVKQDSASSRPMLDLILVVENARDWHTENILRHAHHYSAPCRWLGGGFCASLQRNFGAGVFFHALVPHQNRLIKYGVVQSQDLQQDLEQWKYLYLAGRMHKPILEITSHDAIVELQQTRNLPYALATSLLLLSENDTNAIPLPRLYEQIANLSYAGDIRMNVGGEDPHKVQKLVHSPGQLDRFHHLYQNPLKQLEKEGLVSTISGRTIEWDSTASGQQALWNKLPPRLQGNTRQQQDKLAAALVSIVTPAARSQSLKGIVTAGVVKSLRYAGAKFAKGAFRNFT